MAQGMSIHIGLNLVDPAHYGGWDGKLKACEFDANDMAALATAKGFTQKTLLTKQATAAAVTAEITKAANELQAGDKLLLTYSGHGGQVPDLNSEEDDEYDETWVLYDRELVDDELYALWKRFKPGVRVVVLSDSCHSGSVTRARFINDRAVPEQIEMGLLEEGFEGTKQLPGDVAERTYEEHKQMYDAIQAENPEGDRATVNAAVLLISGCQDEQLSLDGRRNGLFTSKLLKTWDSGAFAGSYRTLHRKIATQMPPTQSPNIFLVGTGANTLRTATAFKI